MDRRLSADDGALPLEASRQGHPDRHPRRRPVRRSAARQQALDTRKLDPAQRRGPGELRHLPPGLHPFHGQRRRHLLPQRRRLRAAGRRQRRAMQWISPMRPSCHVGVVIASGHLYWVPWACDCDLQLTGLICCGPAGDFDFERKASDADAGDRPDTAGSGQSSVVSVGRNTGTDNRHRSPCEAADWPTYRHDNARTALARRPFPEQVRNCSGTTPSKAGRADGAGGRGGPGVYRRRGRHRPGLGCRQRQGLLDGLRRRQRPLPADDRRGPGPGGLRRRLGLCLRRGRRAIAVAFPRGAARAADPRLRRTALHLARRQRRAGGPGHRPILRRASPTTTAPMSMRRCGDRPPPLAEQFQAGRSRRRARTGASPARANCSRAATGSTWPAATPYRPASSTSPTAAA